MKLIARNNGKGKDRESLENPVGGWCQIFTFDIHSTSSYASVTSKDATPSSDPVFQAYTAGGTIIWFGDTLIEGVGASAG